jgi:AraC-like DNA-binding protein
VLARRLGLSNRSLARALEREGTSYRAVLQEVRTTLSAEYLEGGKNSVTEVAFMLGFEDATAFSRAFRQWTTRSPAGFARESSP